NLCYGTGGTKYTHIVTVYRNFDPSTQYKICDRATGMCLASSNSTAGSQVVRAAYNKSASQKWMITQSAAGKYKVVNVQTGMSLDMAGGKTALNTALVQAAYTNSATQQWAFTSVADGTGFFQLKPASVPAMTIGSATNSNNIQLQAWSWLDAQKMAVSLAN
ncbi:MAG TPA: RICIN domain-containing protein, partial [Polyangia bacterium]